MALFNHATRELTAKIVYYGPGLCGKTTNLQVLHSRLDRGTTGKLLSLSTAQDRTIYFDLLPIELGNIKGYTVRFQVCTVPGQVFYNETRKIVLRGVDGLVFVVDSQWSMLSHNLESFQNLRENLLDDKLSLESLPLVVQYNKRDLPNALSVEALQDSLSFHSYPYVEAIASEGKGVTETFRLISKLSFVDLLRRLRKSGVPGESAAAAELAPAPEPIPVAAAPEVRPAPVAVFGTAESEPAPATTEAAWHDPASESVFGDLGGEPPLESSLTTQELAPGPPPAVTNEVPALQAAPRKEPPAALEARLNGVLEEARKEAAYRSGIVRRPNLSSASNASFPAADPDGRTQEIGSSRFVSGDIRKLEEELEKVRSEARETVRAIDEILEARREDQQARLALEEQLHRLEEADATQRDERQRLEERLHRLEEADATQRDERQHLEERLHPLEEANAAQHDERQRLEERLHRLEEANAAQHDERQRLEERLHPLEEANAVQRDERQHLEERLHRLEEADAAQRGERQHLEDRLTTSREEERSEREQLRERLEARLEDQSRLEHLEAEVGRLRDAIEEMSRHADALRGSTEELIRKWTSALKRTLSELGD